MQPLALPNYSRLSRLPDAFPDRSDGFAALEAAMNAAGLEYISSGSFSSVWGDDERVVKRTLPDKGSLATMRAALAHPNNPHLPKVYGFRELDDGTMLVETELLERAYSEEFREWSGQTGMGDRYCAPDLDDCACPVMREALAALIDAADAANDRGANIRWDDHGENIMLRPSDGAIVLTDLLYDKSDLARNRGYEPDEDNSVCNCSDCVAERYC